MAMTSLHGTVLQDHHHARFSLWTKVLLVMHNYLNGKPVGIWKIYPERCILTFKNLKSSILNMSHNLTPHILLSIIIV